MTQTKKKILLPSTMARAGWAILEERSDIEAIPFEYGMPTSAFRALLSDADAVGLSLTPFGDAELDAAPKLRVVARHGVGYDNVDVSALTRRGIPLMVTGKANSPSVAEQALYFMLAFAKRGAQLDTMVREGRWASRFAETLPMDLFGKTVLIVGFGRIGTRVARTCIALGMTVLVFDPYVRPAVIQAAGCIHHTDLDSALPVADFITIHCPRTPETIGMFGAARLARMKPTACLVNTARGGIIDEAALAAALSNGTLAAAGLDVFDKEPPSSDNPLLAAPNTMFAPHMAGVSKESLDRMSIAVAKNLLSVLDGKPDQDNVVNKEVFVRQDLVQSPSHKLHR
jgi:D-3-phosphoglycerate dehydrogenase